MLKEYIGHSSDVFSLIGAAVAAAVALKVTYRFFRFFTAHFLSGPLGLSANLKKAGSWAVVTGCTDGIGKAYAEQLAARGLNVVLLSRTLSKLEELAKQIEEKFKVSTRVIAVDFSRSDIYNEIESKLDGLDIGVLVNNVGMSVFYTYFGEMDSSVQVDMININTVSVAKMTHIVLPRMVQKKVGYIINVGSGAGTHPMPFMSLYSGTKAFVDFFSQSLQAEYGDHGIVIQSLRPFFVETKMSGMSSNIFVPTTTTYVRDALNTLGILPVTTGYWAHSVQGAIMMLFPRFVSEGIFMKTVLGAMEKRAAANKAE